MKSWACVSWGDDGLSLLKWLHLWCLPGHRFDFNCWTWIPAPTTKQAHASTSSVLVFLTIDALKCGAVSTLAVRRACGKIPMVDIQWRLYKRHRKVSNQGTQHIALTPLVFQRLDLSRNVDHMGSYMEHVDFRAQRAAAKGPSPRLRQCHFWESPRWKSHLEMNDWLDP